MYDPQVNSNGMVSMSPDFNQDKPAHRIENKHKGKLIYIWNLMY